MPGILVIVFWCWFAFSVAVLARRAFRKATGRSTRPSTSSLANRPSWPPLQELDLQSVSSTNGAGAVLDEVATPSPTETAAPTGTDEPLSTQADSPTQTQTQTRPRVASLGDALHGIRMPCDLTPLTGTAADFERRAAFFSVGYPAEVVAPEVADELERIGMRFNAISDDTAIAERDGARVRVAVRSVGVAIDGVTDLVYPTAPENCVIVEFELE